MSKYLERLKQLERDGPEPCFPKGSLTGADAEALLEQAEAEYDDCDFVERMREWFEEKGFLTEAQAGAIEAILRDGRGI